MTVKQLIELLSKLPQEYDVMLAERTSDFAYGPVESIYIKSIPFTEEPGGKELSRNKVVVIDEDFL